MEKDYTLEFIRWCLRRAPERTCDVCSRMIDQIMKGESVRARRAFKLKNNGWSTLREVAASECSLSSCAGDLD